MDTVRVTRRSSHKGSIKFSESPLQEFLWTVWTSGLASLPAAKIQIVNCGGVLNNCAPKMYCMSSKL
jgi:hypothetical protein